MKLAVNARVARFAMGGQQRVAAEILNRLGPVEVLEPRTPLGGIKGHLWEQLALPIRAGGKLLWSPSATGPVLMKNQVVTLHDVAFIDVPDYFSPSFVKLYRTLLPALVKRAAKVVTVSEFSRQRIAATLGVPADRIAVIANGVSEHFRPYDRGEIEKTRAALQLPSRYVLLQATSDKRKNLHRTLAAWGRAQGQVADDISLVVSGNLGRSHVFGDMDALPAVPRTVFTGYVDEAHMGPLFSGADALLFPSLYEGFGLPIIEAMRAGTAVLTSAATATQEIAGDAAVLVDPACEEDIERGIVTILNDTAMRERLVRAGLERAAGYSWHSAAEQYRSLFRSLGASV